MTDLNKEREAFEALPQIKGILIGGEFEFSTLSMNYKPKNPKNENHVQCTYFLNGVWYAWLEKAKAQAVLEGCVVVPKQPTPKMIDATWDFDDEILEMSSNTRNEFIWKKMVEASESGAEG